MDNDTETKVYKLANRFSEPSSYAGLSAVLGMLGVSVPGGALQSVVFVLSGIAGLVAFFLPDSVKGK